MNLETARNGSTDKVPVGCLGTVIAPRARCVWALAIAVLTTACAGRLNSAEANAETETLQYERQIKPLLKARCYSCHGALKQESRLRLDTVTFMRAGGKHGDILRSNPGEAGVMLGRIRSTDPSERMPPEGEPLKAEEIENIARWIAGGAPAAAGELPEPDPLSHWSFRTPKRPSIPEVVDVRMKLRTPVDAFVSAEWKRRNIEPVPEAERSHLLRRVYLDLIGLPPTPEEQRRFLADTREDAYERVVDELLDSPRHGERWARHWMDVWRYADWFGRRHVPDVWNSAPQVWRWRDWIIRSLNSDKGYDRMVREMLAGDELEPGNDDVAVATGFLVRNWYALNPNQWMRENVEHTAKAFLGLTLNCAHCHDHKYDPITHKDYFRFRAFFEPLGLRQDWVAGEPDPGPFQKYDYSTLRKVVKEGTIRVMDEQLDAKTYVYLRGDERTFPPDKPVVEPGPPAFLAPSGIPIAPATLPPEIQYPGLKPFIRATLGEQRHKAMDAARMELARAREQHEAARLAAVAGPAGEALAALLEGETRVALASNRLAVATLDLEYLEARIAADDARYGGGAQVPSDSGDLRKKSEVASQVGRRWQLAKAAQKLEELRQQQRLLQLEHRVAAVRREAAGLDASKQQKTRDEEAAALKKLQDQVETAAKGLAAAESALVTNSVNYEPLSPVYGAQTTGRRTALAKWIASRDNPLTARVAVNHVWQWHFHEPLVKTVQDFGRNGSAPSHPELLDWLAVEFMEHGWSLKHLHRLLVTSTTYRLASSRPAGSLGSEAKTPSDPDPENRYLGRMNLGRMESEIVRDSVLSIAGTLDFKGGGYPVANTEADLVPRRSVYFECFPEEGGHDGFTSMFDPPDPGECYRRTRTILPQQSLALSNSAFVDAQSRNAADRVWGKVGGQDGAVERFAAEIFESILNRTGTPEELKIAREFLGEGSDGKVRASFVRALFNHNDFVTIR